MNEKANTEYKFIYLYICNVDFYTQNVVKILLQSFSIQFVHFIIISFQRN